MPAAATLNDKRCPIGPKVVLDTGGAAPTELSGRHVQPMLQIEDGYASGRWITQDIVQIREIVVGQDGADDTCRLALDTLDVEHLEERHFADFLALLSPDVRVRVLMSSPHVGKRILFRGYPQPLTIAWTPESQTISVSCLSEGQEKLRVGPNQQIMGRYMRFDPLSAWNEQAADHVVVPALATTFNAGGRPNRQPEPLPFPRTNDEPGSYGVYLFTEDDAPEALYWTYVQALRYLVYHYIVNAGVPISAIEFLNDTDAIATDESIPSSSNPFVRRVTARPVDLSIESMNLEEAIAVLCERAGLHYQIAIRSTGTLYYLRIYAAIAGAADEADDIDTSLMRAPAVWDLPRAAPFRDYSAASAREIADQNKVQQATLTVDHRRINVLHARGGRTEYEVTLLLRPGWAPHSALDDLTTEAQQQSACEFWRDQFNPEFDEEVGVPARRPRSIYHGAHADHHQVADVFRLWIFPDSWRYANQDLGRERWPEDLYSPYVIIGEPGITRLAWEDDALGGGLPHSIVQSWVPRRRPFRDTIGRKSIYVSDTSPIVRVCFDGQCPETALADGHWIDFAGEVAIDGERAALHFADPNIWDAPMFLAEPLYPAFSATAIEAYIKGIFYVAVTCTIEGDERSYIRRRKKDSYARERNRIIDYGTEQFPSRDQTAGNSHLWHERGADPDPIYRSREGRRELIAQAQRDLERVSAVTVSGDPEIFWLDETYLPGDSFRGVAGLGISFPTYPTIQMVRWVNEGGGWRTVLHLTDLRHGREVGNE